MNSLPNNGVSSTRNDEAYQALDNLHQISNYLRCGIDKNTLAIMINMVENGCKPEQVAAIVSEIKEKTPR